MFLATAQVAADMSWRRDSELTQQRSWAANALEKSNCSALATTRKPTGFSKFLILQVAFVVLFAYFGEFEWPRDYFGVTHVCLPFLASLVGLSAAIVAARVFWRSVLQKKLVGVGDLLAHFSVLGHCRHSLFPLSGVPLRYS